MTTTGGRWYDDDDDDDDGKGFDSLGFWIPRCGFRIPGTASGFFVIGTWIPDFNR